MTDTLNRASAPIDFGRPGWVWRRRGVSARIDRRSVIVSLLLVAVIVLGGLVTLGVGTLSLTPGEVLAALFDPNAPDKHRLVVSTWRLPRLLFAVLCGAALAISGAIFQSLTKNPLGSPDVIGFSAGSYTGAVVVMLFVGSTSYSTIAVGSLIGGAVTAGLVYGLAVRGGLQAFRLIIVGIGVSALLGSLNSLLLLSVSPEQAMLASVWGAGTLSGLGFGQLGPAFLGFLILLVGAAMVGRPLGQLELGDDRARSLGTRAEGGRIWAIVIGVALTALVTAAAGPISFVALAAPQIARRLTRSASVQFVPVALTGAALLVLADLVALNVALPVGVVTVSIGGAYLAWLLVSEYRSRGRTAS